MAELLQHYLVGFDRPTPGQTHTLWPPDENSETPGSSNELRSHAIRLVSKSSREQIGTIIYDVAPWRGMIVAGMLEKTQDSTVPPRDVDHVHVVLIDPTSKLQLSLLPEDLPGLFVDAAGYQQFSSDFQKFHSEISAQLKPGLLVGSKDSEGTRLANTISEIRTALESLVVSSRSDDVQGIWAQLRRLPQPVRDRTDWGFAVHSALDRIEHVETSVEAADPESPNEKSAIAIKYQLQAAAATFDFVWPNVTIDQVLGIATKPDVPDTGETPLEAAIGGMVLRLSKEGYNPDRLAKSIASNAPHTLDLPELKWFSTIVCSFKSLFGSDWEHRLTEIGSPFLAKTLLHVESNSTDVELSHLKEIVRKSDRLDRDYRAFVGLLRDNPERAVHDMISKPGETNLEFVLAIRRVSESKSWAEVLRGLILAQEGRSAPLWNLLSKLTNTVSLARESDLLKWWYEVIDSVTKSRRSLFDIVTGGRNALAPLGSAQYDAPSIEALKRLESSFSSKNWSKPPRNLTRLVHLVSTVRR